MTQPSKSPWGLATRWGERRVNSTSSPLGCQVGSRSKKQFALLPSLTPSTHQASPTHPQPQAQPGRWGAGSAAGLPGIPDTPTHLLCDLGLVPEPLSAFLHSGAIVCFTGWL